MLDRFDELLLDVVDCVIEDVFGKMNANVIYGYLEKKGCPRNDIPTKPEVFSMEMRNIMGRDMGQILGEASILEEAILKALCFQLKTEFDEESPASFAGHVKHLREVYDNGKSGAVQILPKKKR